jgi:soluble lytic murein transglycosylase
MKPSYLYKLAPLLLLWCALGIAKGQTSLGTYSLVEKYAAKYNVPAPLIAALIDVESHWNPRAVSDKGALGLMQLMPGTARTYGAFDPFDPEQNIAAGTRYVTALMWRFNGDFRLVTAAYNAGENRLERPLLNYRNAGVVNYVESVRRRYEQRLAAAKPPERVNEP